MKGSDSILERVALERVTSPEPVFSCYREIIAGITTFCAMAYIICVQPAIQSGQLTGTPTGMNFGALLTSTCLISAFSCIAMGLVARYPFALAPGMGENFFVVLTVFPLCAGLVGHGDAAWQLGLGVVFVSGLLFVLLSLCGLRTMLITILPDSLRLAMGTGIGLFIAWLGLKNAGIIVVDGGQVSMGNLLGWNTIIFLTGLLVAICLKSHGFQGGVLLGILASAVVAIVCGQVPFTGLTGIPASPCPVLFKIDLIGVFRHLYELWPMILILLFMDVFDTLGTVVGLARQTGFMTGSSLPRVERVFLCDAGATMVGALFGHSTVTTFVESAAGVESGGRTGITAVVTGLCFLAALFFTPFLSSLGMCPAVTASALVLVGILMMGNISAIKWQDVSEAVPCFLIIAGIPFCGSIANGILLGTIIYPVVKIVCGKGTEVHPALYPLSALLLFYVICVRG